MMTFPFRAVLIVLCLTVTTVSLPAKAHADDIWLSILRPLVSEVAIPMMNKGLDKLKNKVDTSSYSSSSNGNWSESFTTSDTEPEATIPQEP